MAIAVALPAAACLPAHDEYTVMVVNVHMQQGYVVTFDAGGSSSNRLLVKTDGSGFVYVGSVQPDGARLIVREAASCEIVLQHGPITRKHTQVYIHFDGPPDIGHEDPRRLWDTAEILPASDVCR